MAKRSPAYIFKDMTLNAAGKMQIGQVAELVIPAPEKAMEEFRNGGMVKPREIPLGYSMTEATITMTSFDPDMLKLIGFGSPEDMIAYGYLRDADGTEHAVRVEMVAEVKQINPGTWAPGQRATAEFSVAVHSHTLYIDDAEILHMDDFEVRVGGEVQDPGRASALRL